MQRYGEPFRTRYEPNEIIGHEDYAEVILYNENQEKIAKAKIDLEDIEKIKQHRWQLNDSGYALNYSKAGRMHRFLMGFKKNEGKDNNITVDHINRDRLDNRKLNLRICSMEDNRYNTSLRSDNSSGVIGVSFYRGKWHAELNFKGERVFRESFEKKEDAIKARKNAEIKYFGEYRPDYLPKGLKED